jgi:cardiolipin synthase A/B
MRLLLLVCLVPGLFASTAAIASTESRVRTLHELDTAQGLTNATLHAYTKGDALRLYLSTSNETLMFKAEWRRGRLPSRTFKYYLGTLKFDPTPPRIPAPASSWKQVEVLTGAESRALGRATIEKLGSNLRNEHAIYVRHVLGDAVIYRDEQGEIKYARFADRPRALTVDRQLGIEEFAILGAEAIKTQLQRNHPGKTRFLILSAPQTGGGRTRFNFLDLKERRCVVLIAPHLREDPGGELPLVGDVSSLLRLVVVDHGLAVLKNPVSTVGKILNFGVQWPLAQVGRFRLAGGATLGRVGENSPMDLAAFEKWLDAATGMPREEASLKLLIDGEQFFPMLERRIADARKSVHVHVSIFDRDDVAVHMADLLKAASEVTQVRVLIDHTASWVSGNAPPSTPLPADFMPPKSITSYLHADSSVHIRQYLNPLLTSDHSKLILIDSDFAYIGGMNLGREYRYEWHDMMVEVRGPVLASMERNFEKDWAHAGPLGDFAYAATLLSPQKSRSTPTEQPARASWAEVRRLYTHTGRLQIRRAEIEAIRRARNYLYLENPYLFDHSVVVELTRARARGVDVRVILPSENDLGGATSSNFVTANKLFEHGVRVFFYPGMTHVKALLADGWACFGSANFNTLSLRLNQEGDLATSDPEFTKKLKTDLFETDFSKSYELAEPLSVSWDDHLVDSLLKSF